MFTQNFIKHSAVVHGLQCSQSFDHSENNAVVGQ